MSVTDTVVAACHEAPSACRKPSCGHRYLPERNQAQAALLRIRSDLIGSDVTGTIRERIEMHIKHGLGEDA